MTQHRHILATEAEAERLLTEVLNLPVEPVGAHLSHDEFIGYARETLTPEEEERVDLHLASCNDCTITMERVIEGAKTWHTHQAGSRLAPQREPMPAAVDLPQTLLWLQVTGVVVFEPVRLARTRRLTTRFQAEKHSLETLAHWAHEDVLCIMSEDARGLVFAVDTTNPAYDHTLMRFALVNAITGEEHVTGLLVLHLDRWNRGHYVAAARLDDEVTLPEHCQPRLDLVRLDPARAPDLKALVGAVIAADEDADRQAWREWAQQEVMAKRLAPEVAEAVQQSVANTQ